MIGLPMGVNFSDLSLQAGVSLNIAGLNILSSTSVAFQTEGNELDEWKFEATPGSAGLTKFKIDWKGARYKFKASDFPVRLESKLITTSSTLLKVKLKPGQIDAAFTLDIGGQASISFDADGLVTSSSPGNVLVEVEKPGKKVTLTLPFPLVDTTVITFSGGLVRTVNVGDDLKGSVGRFCIETDFDGSQFSNGAATTPLRLDLSITIGAQEFPGGASLGPDDLMIDDNEWTLEDS